MNILADVNVSAEVVVLPRAAGCEVQRVPAVMNARASDIEIIARARGEGSVVLSHDQDFTAILAVTGATMPSLVNLRVSYVDAERLARSIAAVLHATEDDLAAGAIVTIDDRGARVRRLPVA